MPERIATNTAVAQTVRGTVEHLVQSALQLPYNQKIEASADNRDTSYNHTHTVFWRIPIEADTSQLGVQLAVRGECGPRPTDLAQARLIHIDRNGREGVPAIHLGLHTTATSVEIVDLCRRSTPHLTPSEFLAYSETQTPLGLFALLNTLTRTVTPVEDVQALDFSVPSTSPELPTLEVWAERVRHNTTSQTSYNLGVQHRNEATGASHPLLNVNFKVPDGEPGNLTYVRSPDDDQRVRLSEASLSQAHDLALAGMQRVITALS